MPQVGVRDQGLVFGLPGVPSLAALLARPVAEIKSRVAGDGRSGPVAAADVMLLPPIDGRGLDRMREAFDRQRPNGSLGTPGGSGQLASLVPLASPVSWRRRSGECPGPKAGRCRERRCAGR
jgi:hypothetical protein